MGKRELVALLNLSSWRLVMVERLFLAVPRGCLRFEIVVFSDHTHILFFIVGEPKSRTVQKHTFFAPDRCIARYLYTDSLNSATICAPK